MACHVERRWVLQCRDGKLLMRLTCVNTASVREPPLAEPRWLWSSAPEAGAAGGVVEIDPFMWLSSHWSFIWCVVLHLSESSRRLAKLPSCG